MTTRPFTLEGVWRVMKGARRCRGAPRRGASTAPAARSCRAASRGGAARCGLRGRGVRPVSSHRLNEVTTRLPRFKPDTRSAAAHPQTAGALLPPALTRRRCRRALILNSVLSRTAHKGAAAPPCIRATISHDQLIPATASSGVRTPHRIRSVRASTRAAAAAPTPRSAPPPSGPPHPAAP